MAHQAKASRRTHVKKKSFSSRILLKSVKIQAKTGKNQEKRSKKAEKVLNYFFCPTFCVLLHKK